MAHPDDCVGRISPGVSSFRIGLQATNRAPNTINGYMHAARALGDWLDRVGHSGRLEELSRRDLEAHIADVIAETSASNAAHRFASLQQFFKYLVEVEALDHSPMERMRKPAIPEKPVPLIPEADLEALVAATAGRSFADTRDRATIRLSMETPCRLFS